MGLAIIGNSVNGGTKVKVVTELPATGSSNMIYFVPNNTTGNNKYDEYIWIKDDKNPNGYFEKVGSKDIDLSGYDIKTDLDKKVDKVDGKGLSTNDYDATEKTKVTNLYNTAFHSVDPTAYDKDKVKVTFHSYGTQAPQTVTVNTATSENAGVMSASDKAKLDKFTDDMTNSLLENYKLDTLTYGVEWNDGVADPCITRIGNMKFHRELPIQNGMKGCIAQMKDKPKNPIKYYLNENDWRFKAENPTIINNCVIKNSTITNDVFATLQYENQYVKVKTNDADIIAQITALDTTTKTATLTDENGVAIEDGTHDVELGAVLNGYDGEVMVEVPEFWIRSWEKGDLKQVRVSQTKIDDTWEHQPHALIAPYHDAILRSVPKDMGYISTLSVNALVSICNTNTYCRGGSNNTNYDNYLTTDKIRTLLGKPVTQMNRITARFNARKSSKELLDYLQYKRIIYWLYIIEYANFNSQDTFNSVLTADGYKQGGLGNSVTNVNSSYWSYYNAQNPLTPNGYLNEFGNGTAIKEIKIKIPTTADGSATTDFTTYPHKWHGIENLFGDIWNVTDGIIFDNGSEVIDGKTYSKVYVANTSQLTDTKYDTIENSMKLLTLKPAENGYIKAWNLKNTAEMIPSISGRGGLVNGHPNNTTYKCDQTGSTANKGLTLLFLGSRADIGGVAGLGGFFSGNGVATANASLGFRSYYIIS